MRQYVLRYLVWCLALTLLVGGCDLRLLSGGLPNTGVPKDGVSQTIPLITGQLVDGAGHPVAGANVRAYVAPYRIEALSTEPAASVETTTDAQGAFKLISPPLGSVAVEARGSGQKALRTGVSVAQGAKVDLGTLALQPTGRIAGRVTSTTGTNLLGTDVFIPGTDYLAKTTSDGSYSLQDVPVGVYQLAAVRNNFQPRVLEGVQVLAGKVTEAPDLQLSLDAPVLTSVNPQSGGVGTVVTLRGENFGESKHTTLQVTFGDTLATTVRRKSDTEIEATVPPGATSDGAVVRSNGIASDPLGFRVIATLRIVPSKVGLYPTETASFRCEALDERGALIDSPFVSWALGDPTVGSLDAQGEFTSKGEGVSSVTISSGVCSARGWAGVTPYRMTTAYGNGLPGYPVEQGLAASQALGYPSGLTADSEGNVYVALGTKAQIWRIERDGRMTHVAGNGESGSGGDGGPALQAAFGARVSLAIDGRNRLWISDSWNNLVRFIPLDSRDEASGYRSGYIYRAAGTGQAGYSGSGLPGDQSALNGPQQMAVGPEGVYVADYLNHRIRLITPDLRLVDVMGTGQGIATEHAAPVLNATVYLPTACGVDRQGNLLVGDQYRLLFWCRVPGTYYGQPCEAGMVYPLVGRTVAYPAFVGDGVTASATLSPEALQIDTAGNCWFVENDRPLVRCLTTAGRVETLAGDAEAAAKLVSPTFQGEGISALKATLGDPSGLLLVNEGVLVADAVHHRIRRLERFTGN